MNGFAAPSVMHRQEERGGRPLKPRGSKHSTPSTESPWRGDTRTGRALSYSSRSPAQYVTQLRISLVVPGGFSPETTAILLKMGRELALNGVQRHDR